MKKDKQLEEFEKKDLGKDISRSGSAKVVRPKTIYFDDHLANELKDRKFREAYIRALEDEIKESWGKVSILGDALELIADIAVDYDGYRKAKSLMELIDELRDIARTALKQTNYVNSCVAPERTKKRRVKCR